jgi:hypothetical protein
MSVDLIPDSDIGLGIMHLNTYHVAQGSPEFPPSPAAAPSLSATSSDISGTNLAS